MSSSRVHCTRTALPGNSLASIAASMMKSGLDLRPKPPPNNVTLMVTLSNGMPRRSPMRSRVTCGAWLGAQASHRPSLKRAMATIGSIGACVRCGK
ncbi:hypothetical protein D3C86_1994890 [compost metagenome]